MHMHVLELLFMPQHAESRPKEPHALVVYDMCIAASYARTPVTRPQ